MPRRPATLTQADVARVIRAAKQTGAAGIEVRKDGTMAIMLKGAPLQPEQQEDEFTRWEREHEQAKAARNR